jgi:hypothetical protein
MGGGTPPKTGTPVTARELIADYKANEVSADNAWKGRALLVTGLVDTIGKDILDTPYVTLSSGETTSFPSVQCTSSRGSNEFAGLRKGQQIRVIGICKGKFGNILLDSCSIAGNDVSKEDSTARSTPTPAATDHDRLVWAKNSIANRDYKEADKQLTEISPSSPEYEEAQKLKGTVGQGIAQQRREQAPRLREELASDYRRLIADANPYLNYIQSKIAKAKNGYAIWATHEFFTQYTFSSGSDAAIVQEWIGRNREKLDDADVVRVGLMGRGGFASWCYFDIEKTDRSTNTRRTTTKTDPAANTKNTQDRGAIQRQKRALNALNP